MFMQVPASWQFFCREKIREFRTMLLQAVEPFARSRAEKKTGLLSVERIAGWPDAYDPE